MKISLPSIIAILSLCSSLRAEGPGVQFDGVTYHLASVSVSKQGSVTNEYVKEGESIDSWTTLLAVRHWPKAKKLGDAAGSWLRMIQPLLTQKVEAFKPANVNSDNDVVFEAWISAPDRSYIEINLHRFVIEDGTDGVKAYQFAQKVMMTDGKGDPTSFIKSRNSRIRELGKLQLPLHTKKD